MHPVVFNATFEEALNLIGVFVFAVSGALLAVHKNYDIVGMAVLAEITAIGGGVLRDLVLGADPPAVFTDHISFLLPIGATVLVFIVYRYMAQNQKQGALVRRYRNPLRFAILTFDAAGLGVFCVAGTAKALTYGIGPVEAIALGVLTGVGGGILRDVLANERPAVLRADSELYAVPTLLGSAIIVTIPFLGLYQYSTLAASIAALLVFALRMAALRYGWRAPQPRRAPDRKSASNAQDVQ